MKFKDVSDEYHQCPECSGVLKYERGKTDGKILSTNIIQADYRCWGCGKIWRTKITKNDNH